MDLIKQPNSAHCFVCGLSNPIGLKLAFYETSATELTAVYTAPPHFEGYPDVLHGGIIAALLDEGGSRAAMIGDHQHFRVTARLEVKYRRPTPTGQPLTVYGRLLSRHGRLATALAELRLADGIVTAEAEVTLADLPGGIVPQTHLDALGWKVYPDAAGANDPAVETSLHE